MRPTAATGYATRSRLWAGLAYGCRPNFSPLIEQPRTFAAFCTNHPYFGGRLLTLLRATPEHLRNYFSSIPLFSGILPCWLLARKPRCFWFVSGWATRREHHEHQHPLGTGNGTSSREAEQIKKLITDLTSTVEVLDADIAADEKRPNVHRLSRENRRNIMVTIGTLQDRLFSIEHTVS